MYLGIEIGGSKLQFGVGAGDGPPLVHVERLAVDPAQGAERIRKQIRQVAGRLIEDHRPDGVGLGFGGPVDARAGRTLHSFQVDGWDDFPLVQWCRENLGLPAVLGNDSDLAGLGEARFGAGRDAGVVFYSNVGSGIGGALLLDGKLYQGSSGGVASELGHLRLGPEASAPEKTVERAASGWAIATAARRKLAENPSDPAAADLLDRCLGNPDAIDAKTVAGAYADGNPMAEAVFRDAIRAYGWALAQMITLLAPEFVVIGGGVPLVGEALFLAPLRETVDRYVFPPLRGAFQILPAALGEEVVVHGAVALAADTPGRRE